MVQLHAAHKDTSICMCHMYVLLHIYVSVWQLCKILLLSTVQDRVCVSAHECGLALDRFCVSRDPPYPPWGRVRGYAA